ncbi:MAG: PorV/PorQ family protein [Elusimicrobiota bacterium]
MLIPLGTAHSAQSGAAFLRIGTGARPEAMGGAYTALADDINAIHYNPGGLAGLGKRELGFTHTQWVLDSQFDFVGFGQPTKFGTLGVSFARLATGKQEARSADRQLTGGFEAADSVYTLGCGRMLEGASPWGSLGFGVNAKYLESSIGSDKASTFAADLGAVHRFEGRPLSLGVSVLNMGQGMKFLDQRDPLPLTVSVGGAYRLAGVLGIALDVRHEPNDKSWDVGVGTEYSLFQGFALRAGYASAAVAGRSSKSGAMGLSGLGGGFGIKMRSYRADYTFTPFGELGNVQRISLGARF